MQELWAGMARLLTWGMKAEKTEVSNLNPAFFGICRERTVTLGQCGTEEPMASPPIPKCCHVQQPSPIPQPSALSLGLLQECWLLPEHLSKWNLFPSAVPLMPLTMASVTSKTRAPALW